MLGRGVEKNAREALKLFALALEAGDAQAAHFRDLAAEQLALERVKGRETNTTARAAMKETQRRQRFPKPKLVKSED